MAHETSAPTVSIGVLSAKTGCNVETIRYYERIGLLPPPGRSAGGQRAYRPVDAQRLRFVQRARGLGFSIEDIRGLLRLADRHEPVCVEVRALAATHLAGVQHRLAELARMEATLAALVERCPNDAAADCPIIGTLSRQL